MARRASELHKNTWSLSHGPYACTFANLRFFAGERRSEGRRDNEKLGQVATLDNEKLGQLAKVPSSSRKISTAMAPRVLLGMEGGGRCILHVDLFCQ